jgi:hypothetical protein
MLSQESNGAAPGELRRKAVMHRHALLVDEGVIGVIAEELRVLARRLQRLLEIVNGLWRDVVVLAGEMALKRNLDVGRLDRLFGGSP